MAGGYFELVDDIVARGKKVFVDLKFFDVPETVKRAVARLDGRGVSFATVHGNENILEAACSAKGDVKILAVTVLTSLDEGDLRDLGFSVHSQRAGPFTRQASLSRWLRRRYLIRAGSTGTPR